MSFVSASVRKGGGGREKKKESGLYLLILVGLHACTFMFLFIYIYLMFLYLPKHTCMSLQYIFVLPNFCDMNRKISEYKLCFFSWRNLARVTLPHTRYCLVLLDITTLLLTEVIWEIYSPLLSEIFCACYYCIPRCCLIIWYCLVLLDITTHITDITTNR